jgi:hypothetical protein
VRRLVTLSILLALTACKGKPRHQVPTNVETPTGSAGDHTMKPAPDLKLPTGDGTRPRPSQKPVDKTTLTKLSQLSYPGFQLKLQGITDTVLQVRQLTADHPKLGVTITVKACTDCVPMDVTKWKDKEATLKASLVQEELRGRPDFTWELGNTQLNGQDVIFTYQLGQYMGSDGGGYTDAYALYYNDSVNEIRVVAEYKDDPVRSAADMANLAPKADLERTAKAFMDAYTHAW